MSILLLLLLLCVVLAWLLSFGRSRLDVLAWLPLHACTCSCLLLGFFCVAVLAWLLLLGGLVALDFALSYAPAPLSALDVVLLQFAGWREGERGREGGGRGEEGWRAGREGEREGVREGGRQGDHASTAASRVS